MTDLTCPTCGHPVRIVGTREGTQHYEPIETERQIAALTAERDRLARLVVRMEKLLRQVCMVPRWYQSKGQWLQGHIEAEMKDSGNDLQLAHDSVASAVTP